MKPAGTGIAEDMLICRADTLISALPLDEIRRLWILEPRDS